MKRTDQSAAAVEHFTFVQHHPATDDRVHKGAEEFLLELAAGLPAGTLATAQARGRALALEELVAGVLLDQRMES